MASPIPLFLALSLAAPAPSSDPSSDPWELRYGFLGAPRVEVLVPGDAPRAVVERRLADRPRLEVRAEPDPDGGGARDLPRILALSDPTGIPAALDAPLERMGLSFDEAGFTLHGRTWESPEDGFAATFEDPARPGLPVTLWYANSEPALVAYLEGIEPTFVPGFSAFRAGEVELVGELAVDGRLRTVALEDRRVTWSSRFATDKRISLGSFVFRVPATFDPDRAKAYLVVLREARERTLAWVEPEGSAVIELGSTHVTVHGHAEEMLDLLGAAVLSRVNAVTGHVHVLLGEGVPDDGGAAVAASVARDLLGPPAEEWLGEAAGVAGARSWWGIDLDLWVAHLTAGGLVPDLADVLAGRGSPHLVAPLRAFWLERLLADRGAAHLRDLWSGAERLDPASEAAAFEAALAEHLEAHATDLAAWRSDRDRRELARSWRGGACLMPGPPGAAYGSREARDSLGDLAAAGAGSFSLRVEAHLQPAEPRQPGRLIQEPISASASDVVLASTLADGRAADLSPALAPHLLTTPFGGHTADASLSTQARIEGFFSDYEPFLVHYALLAELCELDLLYVGTGLDGSTKPPREDRSSPYVLAMFAAKEAGWRHLIERARGAYLGPLAYAAGTPSEARKLTFLDALDMVAVELFQSLEPGPDRPGAGPDQAPDLEHLVRALSSTIQSMGRLAEEHDLPLLLSAVGFASTEDCWRRPHLARGATSPDTQLLLYRALLMARRKVERAQPGVLAGLQLWSWSTYPDAGGLADRGFTPQNKPAMEVLPGLLAPPGASSE